MVTLLEVVRKSDMQAGSSSDKSYGVLHPQKLQLTPTAKPKQLLGFILTHIFRHTHAPHVVPFDRALFTSIAGYHLPVRFALAA